MPGGQKINSIIDQDAINAEIKNMRDQLIASAELIKTFPQINKVYSDTNSAAGFRRGTELLHQENEKAKKSIKEMELALQQYERVLGQAATAQARLNVSQSDAGKSLIATREQQRQVNQETKNQVIANDAAEGSLIKLRAQLSLLNRAYDSLAKTERESTKGTDLLGKIKAIDMALKEAEAQTGRFQRNVGNYKSAFDGLGMSFNQVARELPSLTISAQQFFLAISNNLPMVADEIGKVKKEIAALKAEGKEAPSLMSRIKDSLFSWNMALNVGIVLMVAYGKEIGTWIGSLFKASKAMSETARNQKLLLDMQREAADAYGKEKAQLDVLIASLKDEHTPRKQKLELLKELKEKYPGYFDQIKTEKDLIDKLPEAYEKAAKGVLLKANADAAASKLGEFQSERIKMQLDHMEKVNEITANYQKNLASPTLGKPDQRYYDRIKHDYLTLPLEQENKSFQKIMDTKGKELDSKSKFLQQMIVNSKEEISLLGGDLTKPKHEKKEHKPADFTNEILKGEEDLIKAKARLSKLELEEDAKRKLAGFQDEQNNLVSRLRAFKIYLVDKKQLAKISEDEEVAGIKLKLDKIAEIENKKPSSRTNEEKKLLLEKKALLVELQIAELSHANAVEDINRNAAEMITDFWRKQAKDYKKSLVDFVEQEKNDTVAKNFEEQAESIEALNKKLEEGKITLTEYEERKKKLADATVITGLEAEKKALEEEIAINQLFGDSSLDLEKKLNEVKQKLRDKDLEHFKTTAQKKEEIEKKLHEQIKQDEEKAYQFAVAVVDGGFERRLNKIQDEIDANTKLKDAEIQRINDSSLSEQDKAAKLAQVNATAQAKQEQLEMKKRDMQLKQAKFDRDAQVLSIAGNAIAAHFKIMAELGPFGLGLAIANDVAAALEIGLLLAKPLPKYKDGTQSHPGGLAVLGDGGEHEIVTLPGGQQFLSPDTDTLFNLPAGTHVEPISYDEINSLMQSMMIRETAAVLSAAIAPTNKAPETDAKIEKLNDTLLWQTVELKKSLQKQKAPKVSVTVNGDWNNYLQKNVFE